MNRYALILLAMLPCAGLLGCSVSHAGPEDWATFVASRPAAQVNPALPVIPQRTFSLADFGGVGDGKAWNTDAFAKAVAAVKQAGGGRLVVPPGIYLTMPITVTSHMDLHLDAGATILFPDNFADYGLPDPSHSTKKEMEAADGKIPDSLIWGDHLTDVSITGPGTIDGSGAIWWKWSDKAAKKNSGRFYRRPNLVIIRDSERVLIQGVTCTGSPMWNLNPTLCKDVRIEEVKTLEPVLSPNTDGLNPMSCENVLLNNCVLDGGDDCVAIKTVAGAPCFNVLVENLQCKNGHGISIGSETYGGIHDVMVRHCTIEGNKWGIRIKSARDRGNALYGFTYDDIQMNGGGMAIDVDMYYHDTKGEHVQGPVAVTALTPTLQDVIIHNVTATNMGTAGQIVGLPEMFVDGVTLTNVQIGCDTGMEIRDARNIVFNSVKITPGQGVAFTTDHATVTNNP